MILRICPGRSNRLIRSRITRRRLRRRAASIRVLAWNLHLQSRALGIQLCTICPRRWLDIRNGRNLSTLGIRDSSDRWWRRRWRPRHALAIAILLRKLRLGWLIVARRLTHGRANPKMASQHGSSVINRCEDTARLRRQGLWLRRRLTPFRLCLSGHLMLRGRLRQGHRTLLLLLWREGRWH